jgi:hypothetical protein
MDAIKLANKGSGKARGFSITNVYLTMADLKI